MALTSVEEGQIRDILVRYSETLDIAAASTDILAALGYGDVRVVDLPNATALNGTETFYVAQLSDDVKATIQQFSQFAYDNFIDPALDAALIALQAQVDAALASIQAQVNAAISSMINTVNQAINEPKNYFMGQF